MTSPFYRPRFLVLPTSRLIFAWGVWDTEKNPLGSMQTSLPRRQDFVSRHRSLGLAHAKACKLNKLYEQAVAAAEKKVAA